MLLLHLHIKNVWINWYSNTNSLKVEMLFQSIYIYIYLWGMRIDGFQRICINKERISFIAMRPSYLDWLE